MSADSPKISAEDCVVGLDQSKVKHDNRLKKKSKLFEILFRDVPSDTSDDLKLQLVCQRYQDVVQQQKESTLKLKQHEQRIQSIKHERDQLQNERNRLILQKDKLETLCRELQKQNKVIQDENLARNRAEDDKRREVSEHFQTAITAVQTQLNEYQSRNTELRHENQDLATKLNKFIQQHEKREEHVEKLIHTRELETKLTEAKLTKAQCLLDQERIKSQQTIEQLKEEAKLMQERMNMHIALEDKLKEQIEFYKTKYQKFNKTISQSNKLFDTAKAEMDLLAKRVKKSEGDVAEWRGKWELSQRTLLEVAASHKKQVEETKAAKKQSDMLGNLCRALQDQLRELRQSTSTDIEVNEKCPKSSDVPDGLLQDPTDATSTLVPDSHVNHQIPEDIPKASTKDICSEESLSEDFTLIGIGDIVQSEEKNITYQSED